MSERVDKNDAYDITESRKISSRNMQMTNKGLCNT